eukprot:UN33769
MEQRITLELLENVYTSGIANSTENIKMIAMLIGITVKDVENFVFLKKIQSVPDRFIVPDVRPCESYM